MYIIYQCLQYLGCITLLSGSLFKNFNRKSDPWHPKAQYILAAKIGAQGNPKICTKQYHKCPYHPDQLSTLLKKQ